MTTSSAQPSLASLFRIDGKVALVTGASRGIGAAIAAALAESGARVVLVSRSESDLQSVAAIIEGKGGQALVRVCDVTDSAAIRKVIDELPALDIVVNNAGTNLPEPFVNVSDEHLDALINLNTRAVFVVAQAAVRKMQQDPQRANRGAVVLNISSQMGHVGSINRTTYCMTKHAVEGLTKAMAVELAPQGIRVNSIGPTFVDAPLVSRIVDTPEKRAVLVAQIPMGKMASVDDIAAAAAYLVSPAAGMVTGTCLLVDGGWTAR